ncbi:MAG: patatin-like phospholipase family protein [Gaiellaceae bacterium MAG52_C11]|nr:patatin-like phospholipase family protein [Candidatus Gaiellasilicea maunaloa]
MGTIERRLDELAPQTHHVVPSGSAFGRGVERWPDARRPLGVVLSRGGARSLAHIGALAVLADAGFAFDRIGGCSMGSLIGAMAAVGYAPDEIQATCSEELVRRSLFNDYTLPRVALIRSRKAAAMLERRA